VYLFRDRNDTVLYVGKARDLRARLRSYFAGDRQRPAVEAALGALAHVEWRELGSELEASLDELRLIRELRPPANARSTHPPCYLERKADRWAVGSRPTRFGPLASKRQAQLAVRALGDFEGDDLAAVLPALRRRLPRLARELRFEDAARLRDRITALEEVASRIAELERLRAEELCVLAPAREPAFWRAFFVTRGRVARRSVPRGAAGRLEIEAGLAAAATAEPSLAPEDAGELLVVASVLRRPPPELRIVRMRAADILAA
jgi:excinuclease UvrABC nuclease subunit